MTIAEVRALGDAAVLALTLWGEARSEPVEGVIGVACVIRNRLQRRPARFGATYADVCLAPAQFSCWAPAGGAANHQALMALAAALEDDRGPGISDLAFRECRFIAMGIIGGELRDRTGGATHYVTRALHDSASAPTWVKQARVITRVGSHVYMAA